MKRKSRATAIRSCSCRESDIGPVPPCCGESGQRYAEEWDAHSDESDFEGLQITGSNMAKIRELQAMALAACGCEMGRKLRIPRQFCGKSGRKKRTNDETQMNLCPKLRGAIRNDSRPRSSTLKAGKRKMQRKPVSKRSSKGRNKSKKAKSVSFLEYVLGGNTNRVDLTAIQSEKNASCPCVKFLEGMMGGPLPRKVENSCSEMSFDSPSEASYTGPSVMAPSGSAGNMATYLTRNTESPQWKTESPNAMRYLSARRPVVYRFQDEYGWYRRPYSVASILFPSSGPTRREFLSTRGSLPCLGRAPTTRYSSSQHEDMPSVPEPSGRPLEATILKGLEEVEDSPLPSGGRKPTFITMVKTAIRDLRPFRLTSIEAISKYIHLRYKVKNDYLLNYILDWMVDMNILCNWSRHYFFTKQRLVKKTTVAVLPESKKKRRKRHVVKLKKDPEMNRGWSRWHRKIKQVKEIVKGRNANKPKRKRKKLAKRATEKPRKRSTHKKKTHRKKKPTKKAKDWEDDESLFEGTESLESLNSEETIVPPPKKRKTRKKKHTAKCRRDKTKKKQDKCTCTKELSSAKNRIKLRSRYVRRGDKIYKEEEFI